MLEAGQWFLFVGHCYDDKGSLFSFILLFTSVYHQCHSNRSSGDLLGERGVMFYIKRRLSRPFIPPLSLPLTDTVDPFYQQVDLGSRDWWYIVQSAVINNQLKDPRTRNLLPIMEKKFSIDFLPSLSSICNLPSGIKEVCTIRSWSQGLGETYFPT